MSAFRRVADDQAGPAALGLLVPPGRRTVVIVRPRSLPWDLLIVQSHPRTGATTTFREFGREEALAATEGLEQALEQWTLGGRGQVEAAPAPGGGHFVRVQVRIFPLLACLRQPGRPYQPLVLTEPQEAQQAVAAVKAVLCPTQGAGQELYCNVRNFAR
jgi:hypothetical protein